MIRQLRSLLIFAAYGALISTSLAEDAATPPNPTPSDLRRASIFDKLAGVTVTGSLRSRLYAWDWFEPASGNNS